MPLFLVGGGGGGGYLCACGEETAMAVNYSCLKPQLNIRKTRLWLCSLVRACCASRSMPAPGSTFLLSK